MGKIHAMTTKVFQTIKKWFSQRIQRIEWWAQFYAATIPIALIIAFDSANKDQGIFMQNLGFAGNWLVYTAIATILGIFIHISIFDIAPNVKRINDFIRRRNNS